MTLHSHHDHAALEQLAAAISPEQFATALLSGEGHLPRLTVISRRTRISQDVYVEQGWFWHSWAERIAPVTDASLAAAKIADMLRGTLPPSPAPPPLLPASADTTGSLIPAQRGKNRE